MTRTALLPLPLTKEIRALAVPWLACLVTMVAAAVLGAGQFRSLGVVAYFLGATALGAVSIGHEYSHHTLTMLLAQPARRERLLLAKLGVLLVMLLLLCAVAAVVLFNATGSFPGAWPSAALARPSRLLLQREYVLWALWLPVLGGVIVAPWLTMLFRNPIAGVVFTVCIPGMLALTGALLGMAVYGRFAPEVDGFQLAFFRPSVLGFCAIGAVMGWRTFMRLEAIEGPGQDVRLPAFALGPFAALRRGRPQWLRWRTALTFTKRNPVWLLVKKELRLQQMTLVVAGLYPLSWLAVSFSSQGPVVRDVGDLFTTLTFVYAGLLALLIGSLGSAGERQLDTLEWQVLLPLATSKQWAVKMGVVFGLAMLLALGVAAVAASLNPAMDPNPFLRPDLAVVLDLAVVIVLLTAGSLYVSSLCTSGLWALLISIPATFGAVTFVGVAIARVAASRAGSSRVAGGMASTGFGPGPLTLTRALTLLLIAGFIAVLLRFALANHRSSERTAGRVWKQVIVMGAFVTAGVVILAGVDPFDR